MKFNAILSLFLTVCLLGAGSFVQAQDSGNSPAGEASPEEVGLEISEDVALEWKDYSIKAYTLTVWGGSASGATYLENDPTVPRTVFEIGANDVIAYDGTTLFESRHPDYGAAQKEFKSANAYGGRIGIYIADDFHLDMVASYSAGEAVTTMIYTDPEVPNTSERIVVDTDPGFKAYKGGLALMYDANSSTIFGLVPHIGFGLGGTINRFTELEDKTALYIEGIIGLSYEVMENLDFNVQADLTTFAFEVDELGYSNMVSYATFSAGLSWYFDRVPEAARAEHIAEK